MDNRSSDVKLESAEEEEEIFEIQDFTTVFEWEKFIARMEEIIHEWKLNSVPHYILNKGDIEDSTFETLRERITYEGIQFVVTRFTLDLKKSKSSNHSPCIDTPISSLDDTNQFELMQHINKTFPYSDIISHLNEFSPHTHCLTRWFGIHDFLTLAPLETAHDIIRDESRVKQLVSSMNIALANTECTIPVFVQINNYRRHYCGVGIHTSLGLITNYEMVCLQDIPDQFTHLSGLLELFIERLGCVSQSVKMTVSIRFTFLKSPKNLSYGQWTPFGTPSPKNEKSINHTVIKYKKLPLGTWIEPLTYLQLSTVWLHQPSETIVETSTYCDLDPEAAPVWTLRLVPTEEPRCILCGLLKRFLRMASQTSSTLGGLFQGSSFSTSHKVDTTNTLQVSPTQPEISRALNRLTNPNLPPVISAVDKLQKTSLVSTSQSSTISRDFMDELLFYLFPDAVAKNSSSKNTADRLTVTVSEYKLNIDDSVSRDIFCEDYDAESTEDASAYSRISKNVSVYSLLSDVRSVVKTAPVDSLLWRLTIIVALLHDNQTFGVKAMKELWFEFVLELRYRWENSHIIPGLERGLPNFTHCLLYQKLQKLNCCIERKIEREKRIHSTINTEKNLADELKDISSSHDKGSKTKTFNTNSSHDMMLDQLDNDELDGGGEGWHIDDQDFLKNISAAGENENDDNEDEFFECEETFSVKSVNNDDAEFTIDERDIANAVGRNIEKEQFYKPEGRFKKHDSLMLIDHSDIPLYIPITQDSAPLTEEDIENQMASFTSLGTSTEGMDVRIRIQSQSLLSDMQAFKAANPGCLLADFIRWHSPRDWIENDGSRVDQGVNDASESPESRTKGYLSERMTTPGNIWQELWSQAGERGMPVRRQKRLFDDTKEAESIFQWLTDLADSSHSNSPTLGTVLCPILFHASVERLLTSHTFASIIKYSTKLQKFSQDCIDKIGLISKETSQSVNHHSYMDLIKIMNSMETIVSRANSLRLKFSSTNCCELPSKGMMNSFITQILEKPEAKIVGAARSPLGQVINTIFTSEDDPSDADTGSSSAIRKDNIPKDNRKKVDPDSRDSNVTFSSNTKYSSRFPSPTGREYIIRTVMPRPASYSKPTPQRMFAVLLDDSVRICTAITEDTTFS